MNHLICSPGHQRKIGDQSKYHINNTENFIQKLHHISLQLTDICQISTWSAGLPESYWRTHCCCCYSTLRNRPQLPSDRLSPQLISFTAAHSMIKEVA